MNLHYLEQAEYETYYPKIMLQQRMNKNITILKDCELPSDDFDIDFKA